jgi:putative ABC transport system permease protein
VNGSRTGSPVAEAIQKEIPGVLNTTRLVTDWDIVKVGENVYSEPRVFYVDSTFLDIFDYKVLNGDKKNLLNKPRTVVLTESTANKYFGDKSPIGEIIKFGSLDFQVTGVVEDCKRTSHFHYDLLVSIVSLSSSRYETVLRNDFFNVYVLLDTNAEIEKVNSAFHNMMLKKIEPDVSYFFGISVSDFLKKGNAVNFHLSPIHSIHLNSHSWAEIEANSSIVYIYIFFLIALLIMIIACINYMNLSTARSANRAKETAIRKVVGARKGVLISQFLTESVLQSLIALLLALIFIESVLPAFNRLTAQDLSIGYTQNIWVIPGLLLVGVLIGLFSGVYSAIHLSSVNIIVMLKARFLTGKQHKWFRNILVVFQFSISIFIIITTFIIYSQLNYIQNKDMGYDKRNMLVLKNIVLFRNGVDVLKQRLNGIPGVLSVTGSCHVIGEAFNGFPARSEDDMNTARVSRMLVADNNIDKTLGLKVVEGRFFSDDYPNDTFSVVINETAAREYNFKNPIGKYMVTKEGDNTQKWKIIGVIKDFNFYSLHEKIMSLVILHYSQRTPSYITIRYDCQRIDELISSVKNSWVELFPDIPFEYFFFDDKYKSIYNEEYRTGKLFTTFSVLAIIISCLGLYGLSSFLAEKKTREIAIRKIVGASERTVVLMLIKQFTSWTLIANIIAYPIAWIFAKKWLQNFAYHVDIKVWYFVLATIIVFIIAIITVTTQALVAARTNPADKLKYE